MPLTNHGTSSIDLNSLLSACRESIVPVALLSASESEFLTDPQREVGDHQWRPAVLSHRCSVQLGCT